jgi:hypothetical protein
MLGELVTLRRAVLRVAIASGIDMKRLLLAYAAALTASGPAVAHHSPAAFDLTKEVVVEGAITDVSWKNPHVYFTVQSVGADGRAVEQEIHAGSASALIGMGVSREALAVGNRVSVRAFPPRRAAARVVLGFELTAETGELLTLEYVGRSRAANSPPATVAANSIGGRWLPQRSGGGYLAAVRQRLTAAGQASAADVDSYRAVMARCEEEVAPLVMVLPMVRDITADARTVKIAVDWTGAERVIHLGNADVEPSAQGHSSGRWEGETLVVETVAFAPNRSGVIPGVSSGRAKRMVERFTLTEDKLHLRYEFTIEDPEYLAEPVSFTQLWDHRPDMALSGETCDPAVAERFLELE